MPNIFPHSYVAKLVFSRSSLPGSRYFRRRQRWRRLQEREERVNNAQNGTGGTRRRRPPAGCLLCALPRLSRGCSRPRRRSRAPGDSGSPRPGGAGQERAPPAGRPLPARPSPPAQRLPFAANREARGVSRRAREPMAARGGGEGRDRAPSTPGLSAAPVTVPQGGQRSLRPRRRRRRLRSALGHAAALKCSRAASCLSCSPACCFGDWTPAQVALPSLASQRRHPLPRRSGQPLAAGSAGRQRAGADRRARTASLAWPPSRAAG